MNKASLLAAGFALGALALSANAVLVVDGDLPDPNLNNVSGPSRSNVAGDPSPARFYAAGDGFSLGALDPG